MTCFFCARVPRCGEAPAGNRDAPVGKIRPSTSGGKLAVGEYRVATQHIVRRNGAYRVRRTYRTCVSTIPHCDSRWSRAWLPPANRTSPRLVLRLPTVACIGNSNKKQVFENYDILDCHLSAFAKHSRRRGLPRSAFKKHCVSSAFYYIFPGFISVLRPYSVRVTLDAIKSPLHEPS